MPGVPKGEGLLLLRVWYHDGTPVARLLSLSGDDRSSLDDLAPVAGVASILDAVARWLESTGSDDARDPLSGTPR